MLSAFLVSLPLVVEKRKHVLTLLSHNAAETHTTITAGLASAFWSLGRCVEICKAHARHPALETYLYHAVTQPIPHCVHHTLKITHAKIDIPIQGSQMDLRGDSGQIEAILLLCWLLRELCL